MARRAKIFLSYRRGDTAGHVGRLHDELVRTFGAHRVFMDIDSLKPGDDFSQVLRQRLGESLVVLVAIGPRWMGRNDDGTRRIDDPNDFVRLEVGTALADPKTRVIPVLCEGARIPGETALPPELQELSRRNAFELSDTRWHHDVASLFGVVQSLVPVAGRGKRLLLRAGRVVGVVALLAAALAWGYQALRTQFTRLSTNEQDAAPSSRDRRGASAPPKPRAGDAESRMPSAPPPRLVPPRIVRSASQQLARARREWVADAELTSIRVDCTRQNEGPCPLMLRFWSASRFATLESTQSIPDSAWTYRQTGGGSNLPALSLDIPEFEQIAAQAKSLGVTSDLDRLSLEQLRLQNNSIAPRWILWPRNREQGGREGRLCFEPRSTAHVDCRTGQ